MTTPDTEPTVSHIASALDEALTGRRLLDHPYYRAWEKGELTTQDLAEYAEQYRHFEQVLPEVLETIIGHQIENSARKLVASNLDDERGRPQPHVDLFERFASAIDARPNIAPREATTRLLKVYRSAAHANPAAGLAVIAGYEIQAAAVAATKADALRRHYHLDRADTAFWDVHAAMEHDHAEWTTEALADLNADSNETCEFASRSTQAWWDFLDQREATRAA